MNRTNKLSDFIFILLFSLLVLQFSTAQSIAESPRLEAEPWTYYFSENLDTSDWRSLFELAFHVSGVADGSENSADAFEPYILELSKETFSMNERAKAEYVLAFMHRRFLKRYSVYQTRIDRLLATGQYNCVSSAMLYAILAVSAGLDVSGVGTSDHAFCSVTVNGEQVDVETTNLYGFDPGTKTDFHDEFGKTTGYAYVSPKNYRDRNSLSLLNLFSLTLSNRIAEAESDRRYNEAVGLAVDRWVLLGSLPGQNFEDIIDRMLNLGAALAKNGKEGDALKWAERAISVYGPNEKWNNFIDSAANNMLVKLLRSGRVDEARQQFEILKPGLTAETAANLDSTITETEILEALNAVEPGGDDSNFYNILEKAGKAGIVTSDRLREFEESRIMSEIDYVSKTEGWEAAYLAAQKAISSFGSSLRLEKVLNISKKNHIAELYNKAALAFNEGRYSDANISITEAIAEFPDEKSFMSLLNAIEQKQKE